MANFYGSKPRGSKGNSQPRGTKDSTLVPTHEDGQALKCSYLHQLEGAIKARTPIAGAGITIQTADGGSTFSLSGGLVTLNVCSNGVPSTLIVYGVAGAPYTP